MFPVLPIISIIPLLELNQKINDSLNKNISHFCPFSLGKNKSQNHCAHYVSHIMGYELPGASCKNFTYADKQLPDKGATIRVNDIFAKSTEKGPLANKPAAFESCLIFVTISSNVTRKNGVYSMGSHPRKHIGILWGGKIWNYSNTQNKVVADTVSGFETKFKRAYKTPGATVDFYYGKFL